MAWAVLVAAAGYGAHAADDANLELGRKVFTELAQPSCALCHTLEAAGAAGTIGPSLDELDPDAERVLKAVRDGIGAMPSYAGRLTPRQLKAVAGYVDQAAGSAGSGERGAPSRASTCSDLNAAKRRVTGPAPALAIAACAGRGSR